MARRYRINCESVCVLHCKGSNYHVVLENLSLDGALLKIDSKVLDYVSPDDVCDLMLCSNPVACPVKYSCKIVRFDEDHIGVKFVGHG